MGFNLRSEYTPQGDQQQAIDALVRGLDEGVRDQVLLGITGSGKTFSVASVIQHTQRPTLVIAHNKTLAAQLYQEFKSFFPENSVEYFVSYYDYYLPPDTIVVIDESHQTVPQIRGMFNGDQSRKRTLVEYGFRLPSAMDNRPLNFAEFEQRVGQTIYVSATPGPYELTKTGGEVVEQLIRPTGLTDPEVDVRPVKGQIDDLLEECRLRAERDERVLVTTLTKKMAEDLTEYFAEVGVRVRYLHSDIETLERIKILRDLRRGEFDVLVGITLLREGLDLPEVSLVAILDADKEGFLRSEQSLIQT